MAVVDDKKEVKEYFNNEGFNRWSKIYSESDDEDGSAANGETFCDAGCGVGSLAIPLAQMGAKVRASDISEAMANEGAAPARALKGSVTFETADLESLNAKRFIISFAPFTPFYAALKFVGSLAPGPSKATRAYLHAESDVVAALEKRGKGEYEEIEILTVLGFRIQGEAIGHDSYQLLLLEIVGSGKGVEKRSPAETLLYAG
eukprot:764783-Hanusia_phi.AAC.11